MKTSKYEGGNKLYQVVERLPEGKHEMQKLDGK
jgi:hypothetical protein